MANRSSSADTLLSSLWSLSVSSLSDEGRIEGGEERRVYIYIYIYIGVKEGLRKRLMSQALSRKEKITFDP